MLEADFSKNYIWRLLTAFLRYVLTHSHTVTTAVMVTTRQYNTLLERFSMYLPTRKYNPPQSRTLWRGERHKEDGLGWTKLYAL